MKRLVGTVAAAVVALSGLVTTPAQSAVGVGRVVTHTPPSVNDGPVRTDPVNVGHAKCRMSATAGFWGGYCGGGGGEDTTIWDLLNEAGTHVYLVTIDVSEMPCIYVSLPEGFNLDLIDAQPGADFRPLRRICIGGGEQDEQGKWKHKDGEEVTVSVDVVWVPGNSGIISTTTGHATSILREAGAKYPVPGIAAWPSRTTVTGADTQGTRTRVNVATYLHLVPPSFEETHKDIFGGLTMRVELDSFSFDPDDGRPTQVCPGYGDEVLARNGRVPDPDGSSCYLMFDRAGPRDVTVTMYWHVSYSVDGVDWHDVGPPDRAFTSQNVLHLTVQDVQTIVVS